tara:strand:+ start:18706 stop:19074 length:369 start_codon:yes stop_codon:yes gene_type:complete
MKITIDTKEDSHEEIQKAIKLLSSLIPGEVMSNSGDLFDGDSPSLDANKSSDIFGDDTPSSPSESSDDSSSSSGSGGGIFNMFGGNSGDSGSSESTISEDTTEETTDKEDITIDTPEVEEYR